MARINDIYEMAKKLNLWNIARGDIDLNNRKLSNLDYLEYVLMEELKLRDQQRFIRNLKASKLPLVDFNIERLHDGVKWHYNQLLQLKWIEEEENLIVIGNCSIGKTSMITSICNTGITNDYKVYYATIERFLAIIKGKDIEPKYKKIFNYLKLCDVIVIDDLFYLTMTSEDMQILYRAILFLNETRSIILISNRKLENWNEVCEDKHLMQTFLERVTNDSQIIIVG